VKGQLKRLIAPTISALLLLAGSQLGGFFGLLLLTYGVPVSAGALAVTLVDWENAHGRTTCYSAVGGVAVFFCLLVGVAYALTDWLAGVHAAHLLLIGFAFLAGTIAFVAEGKCVAARTIRDYKSNLIERKLLESLNSEVATDNDARSE
jgi:hypothetical protein